MRTGAAGAVPLAQTIAAQTVNPSTPPPTTPATTRPSTSIDPVSSTSARDYVTTAPQSLWEVAESVWGSDATVRFPSLVEANKGRVDPDVVLPVGTRVAIPATTDDWRVVTAQSGDTYLKIATDLGRPDVRAELYDVNHSRTGHSVEAGEQIAVPVDPATLSGSAQHDVVDGDTEWDIVEEQYGKPASVAEHWDMIHGLHEANRGVLDADGAHALYEEDLIHPGQSLELPAILAGRPLLNPTPTTPAPEAANDAAAKEASAKDAAKEAEAEKAAEKEAAAKEAEAKEAAAKKASVPVTTNAPAPTVVAADATARTRDGDGPDRDALGGTRTGVGIEATQRATNDVVVDDNLVNEVSNSSIGPRLALATIGIGVLGGIWELRRRRRRHSKPRTATPKHLEETERDLAEAAAASHLHHARAVLTPLFNELADESALVMAICVSDGTVVVHLDEELPPAGPFAGDPGCWTIDVEDLIDIDSGHRILPSLVTLGFTDDEQEVFVDLESLGSVQVTGGPKADDLIRSMATQLATRTDTVIELYTTVAVADTVTGGAVVNVDTLDPSTLDLILSGSSQVRTLLASTDLAASPQARWTDNHGTLPAVIVALTGTHPTDTISRLTERAAGGSGLAVVTTQPLNNGAARLGLTDTGLELETNDGLHLTIEHPALLATSTAANIAELLAHEHTETNTPASRPRMDTLASIGLTDADEGGATMDVGETERHRKFPLLCWSR